MKTVALTLLLLPLILLPKAALADVPGLINYQGMLSDEIGVALDTTLDLTFAIYADSTGGDPIWWETQPSVQVTGGLFNILLGSVNVISDTVFNSVSRWLSVEVGGEAELQPRQRIVSVGYALKAAEADSANWARFVSTGNDSDWIISGNNMYCAVSGNVGIGTTSPDDAKLKVVYRENSVLIGTSEVAIIGYSPQDHPGGLGVMGGSRERCGVYGYTETHGIGVEGTSPSGFGVHGGSASGFGVVGESGSNIGVYGKQVNSRNYGYLGSDSCGVYGYSDSDTSYAGYFQGNVNVSGNVGIGATSPSEKLEVNGVTQMTGFKMPTDASDSYVLTSDSVGVGSWQPAPAIADSDWTIFGNNMYSAVSGNVGIGTTSPSAMLHIAGHYLPLTFERDDVPAHNNKFSFSINHHDLEINPWGEDGDVIFFQSADPGFKSGNVGIGTGNPTEKLEVNGNVKADTLFGDGSTLTGVITSLKTYDSGWFAVSEMTTDTLTHNLGTDLFIPMVWLKDGLGNISGPRGGVAGFEEYAGSIHGLAFLSPTSSQVFLRLQYPQNSVMKSDGSTSEVTEARVLLLALE